MTQAKRSPRSIIGYCFFAILLGVVFLGVWGKRLVDDVVNDAAPESSIHFIRSNTSRMRIVMSIMQHAQPAQREIFAPLVPEIKSAADDTEQRVQQLSAQFRGEGAITSALAEIGKLNGELLSDWERRQSAKEAPPDPDTLKKNNAMQADRFDHIRKDCAELAEIVGKLSAERLMRDQVWFFLVCAATLAITVFTSAQVNKAFRQRAMEEAREA